MLRRPENNNACTRKHPRHPFSVSELVHEGTLKTHTMQAMVRTIQRTIPWFCQLDVQTINMELEKFHWQFCLWRAHVMQESNMKAKERQEKSYQIKWTSKLCNDLLRIACWTWKVHNITTICPNKRRIQYIWMNVYVSTAHLLSSSRLWGSPPSESWPASKPGHQTLLELYIIIIYQSPIKGPWWETIGILLANYNMNAVQ